MKRPIKIMLGIILALVLAGAAIFLIQGNYVQGLMRHAYDTSKCYDSDGGKNYETKGTTYGKMGTRDKQTQYIDSCNGATLTEYYCDGTKVKKEEKACSKCADGKCDNDPCNQTNFSTAFILLYENESQLTGERINTFNEMKDDFSGSFKYATYDLATMDTSGEIFLMKMEEDMFYVDVNNDKNIDIYNISKKYYSTHDDIHYFLIIGLAFDPPQNVMNEANAYLKGVKIDINGIGFKPYDYSNLYGTTGKLHGIVILNQDIKKYGPAFKIFNETPSQIFLHEIGHQWCCTIGDEFGFGDNLEITTGMHWYMGLESGYEGTSPMGANHWVSNDDGTYKTFSAPDGTKPRYHKFMLYFMGLLNPEEYGKKYPVYDFCFQSNPWCETKATLWKEVSINDIISIEGDRYCENFSN